HLICGGGTEQRCKRSGGGREACHPRCVGSTRRRWRHSISHRALPFNLGRGVPTRRFVPRTPTPLRHPFPPRRPQLVITSSADCSSPSGTVKSACVGRSQRVQRS